MRRSSPSQSDESPSDYPHRREPPCSREGLEQEENMVGGMNCHPKHGGRRSPWGRGSGTRRTWSEGTVNYRSGC